MLESVILRIEFLTLDAIKSTRRMTDGLSGRCTFIPSNVAVLILFAHAAWLGLLTTLPFFRELPFLVKELATDL